MNKLYTLIIGLLFCYFAYIPSISAQTSTHPVNNYYSTPFGQLDYMRLTPKEATFAGVCDQNNLGAIYYNSDDIALYGCSNDPIDPSTYSWNIILSGNAAGGNIWNSTIGLPANNLFLDPPNEDSHVGILTDDPQTNLHIKYSASWPLNGTNKYGGIHFNQLSNGKFVGITASGKSNLDETNAGVMFEYPDTSSSRIHFLTTDDYNLGMKDKIALDEGGNLGVGTTNPVVDFHIIEEGANEAGILIQDATTGTTNNDGLSIVLAPSLEANITNHEETNMQLGKAVAHFYFDQSTQPGYVKTSYRTTSIPNPILAGGNNNELSIGGSLVVNNKMFASSQALSINQTNPSQPIRFRTFQANTGLLVNKHTGSTYGKLSIENNIFEIQYYTSDNGLYLSGSSLGIAGPPDNNVAIKVHGDVRFSGELCLQSDPNDYASNNCLSMDVAAPRIEAGRGKYCDKQQVSSPKSCMFDNTGGNGDWSKEPICVVSVSREQWIADGKNPSYLNNYAERFKIIDKRPSGSDTVLNTLRISHDSPTKTNPIPLNWICVADQ